MKKSRIPFQFWGPFHLGVSKHPGRTPLSHPTVGFKRDPYICCWKWNNPHITWLVTFLRCIGILYFIFDIFCFAPNTNRKKKKTATARRIFQCSVRGPASCTFALKLCAFKRMAAMLACLKSSERRNSKKKPSGFFHGFLAAGKRWKCFHGTGNGETKAKRSKKGWVVLTSNKNTPWKLNSSRTMLQN